jgi:hypothetical protein
LVRLRCPLGLVDRHAEGVGSHNGDSGRNASPPPWYALGHTVLGREGRRLAAVLACGPGAVLSHRSAATARASELERALAQAERLCVYDHRAITDVIVRCNGHRGTRVLAQATTREPKWTRNEWEAEFLRLLRDAGLPEPQTHDALDAPDHGHCEPDYHWPSHHVIVETDGFETHGSRAAFRNDRAKDAALTASGYRVLRFTRDDDPELAIKRLRALLPSAGTHPRSGSPVR